MSQIVYEISLSNNVISLLQEKLLPLFPGHTLNFSVAWIEDTKNPGYQTTITCRVKNHVRNHEFTYIEGFGKTVDESFNSLYANAITSLTHKIDQLKEELEKYTANQQSKIAAHSKVIEELNSSKSNK